MYLKPFSNTKEHRMSELSIKFPWNSIWKITWSTNEGLIFKAWFSVHLNDEIINLFGGIQIRIIVSIIKRYNWFIYDCILSLFMYYFSIHNIDMISNYKAIIYVKWVYRWISNFCESYHISYHTSYHITLQGTIKSSWIINIA